MMMRRRFGPALPVNLLLAVIFIVVIVFEKANVDGFCTNSFSISRTYHRRPASSIQNLDDFIVHDKILGRSRCCLHAVSSTTSTPVVTNGFLDDRDDDNEETTINVGPSPSTNSRRSFLTRIGPAAAASLYALTANNSPAAADADDSAITTNSFDRSSSSTSTAAAAAATTKRNVRYVLDDETGEYVEVEDPTWQEAWRNRWNEASTMSTDQILEAARGAGNVDKKSLDNESPASKRRRALSACRNPDVRARVVDVNGGGGGNTLNERDCTARVLKDGEVDFILGAL